MKTLGFMSTLPEVNRKLGKLRTWASFSQTTCWCHFKDFFGCLILQERVRLHVFIAKISYVPFILLILFSILIDL